MSVVSVNSVNSVETSDFNWNEYQKLTDEFTEEVEKKKTFLENSFRKTLINFLVFSHMYLFFFQTIGKEHTKLLFGALLLLYLDNKCRKKYGIELVDVVNETEEIRVLDEDSVD